MNFALPPGATDADVIREIAKQLGWIVNSLPKLEPVTFVRGKTVFRRAASVLDDISQENKLKWDVKEGKLIFTPGLEEHERKIWEVIQHQPSLRGRKYCQTLDKKEIEPPRKGVWEECPRSYTEAFHLKDRRGKYPWRPRIWDEKYKICRKAERFSFASE